MIETDAMSVARLIALLLLTSLPHGPATAVDAASACLDAAAMAERNWALPAELIGAIGRVESGRFNRATGRVVPWPWTVNANGNGFYFASLPDAVSFVRTLQSRGIRLIDVGCFQIDLFYHPAAFTSLEQAFDPSANADYAARFLTGLRERTGSWPAAIAGYHSGLPLEGESYRVKVMAHWRSGGRITLPTTPFAGVEAVRGQSAQDPHVVLMSMAARAIRVFGP